MKKQLAITLVNKTDQELHIHLCVTCDDVFECGAIAYNGETGKSGGGDLAPCNLPIVFRDCSGHTKEKD